MATFWEGLGNTIGDITGYNQANRSAEADAQMKKTQAAATKGYATSGATLGAAGKTAGQLAGKSATTFAGEAGKAGQALGSQMGTEAATQGSQAATQAARTAGVNKGQAALLGGQEAGRAFTQGQQAGRGMGMSAYGQGANTQLGAVGTQGQVGSAQGANAANIGSMGTAQGSQALGQSAQGSQATGGLINAIGGLITSDENLKDNIKASPDINEIMRKIKPVDFNYKPEAGEGAEKTIGVTAQDMEKTPLKANVVNTPKGKMVDGPKQENSNLNLIIELASKVKELEGQLKGRK